MKGIQNIFPICLVIGLFFLLISPSFLTDGMFIDGLWYATISKNMSEGVCSFWAPRLSETRWAWGQPPMAFWLQSPFFLINKNLYMAKIYSVLTYVCTSGIMYLVWKEIGGQLRHFWIVLLLWITVPLVYWGATNNVLENTMSIFVMLSILFYLKGLEKHRFICVILSGLMLSLAFLTKGFTGLYPLALPFIYYLCMRNQRLSAVFSDTLCMLVSLMLPLMFLYLLNPSAKHFFGMYMSEQVINSISNVQTVGNRFYIVLRFFEEIITPLVIVGIVVLVALKQKRLRMSVKRINLKCSVTFGLLALSGVIPMMISLKQSGFYLITVFPVFAIALGIALAPMLEDIAVSRRFNQIAKVFSFLVLMSAVTVNIYFAGREGRDKELIADVNLISEQIPENTIIGANKKLSDSWSMMAYFYFQKKISIDFEREHTYLLCGTNAEPVDSEYTPIVKGKTLQLFQKP